MLKKYFNNQKYGVTSSTILKVLKIFMEKLTIDIAREIGSEGCVFMLDEVEAQVESHWIYPI